MVDDELPDGKAKLENPGEAPAREGKGPADELLSRLVHRQAELARERAGAPALLDELLALPPGAQLDRIGSDPRFLNWGMFERLLERSSQEEERDPAESGRLAFLVLAAADFLEQRSHAPAVIEDLKARAWAAVGEARRRAGALHGAEEALRSAAACLLHGTGDLLVEARLLEFEAAVRRDQGLQGEALALLKRASTRYLEAHEFRLLSRVLGKREQLLREAPKPGILPAGPALPS